MTPRVDLPDALRGPNLEQIRVSGPESLELSGDRPVEIWLNGVAGAVDAFAQVWVVNLDQAGPAVTATADEAGAFGLPLVVRVGERLRIQLRSEQGHSGALTVQVQLVDLQIVLVEWDERLECFGVVPPYEVNFDRGESGVELTNRCGEAASFEQVTLRLGDAGFGLGELPVDLPSGQSVRIDMTFNPEPRARGEQMDILLLDVALSDGRTGRWDLGVWGSPGR